MAEGMTFEEDILKLVVDQFGWRVVVTLDLIADDFHFLVDLLLWIQAVEHDVCQHIDGLSKMLLRDGGIEAGVFFVGEGVEFTAQSLDGIDNLEGIAPCGALEGHVLTEMGEPFFVWQLVARAGGNVIAAIDDL